MDRRHFLTLAGASAASSVIPPAFAQTDYPARTVKIVCGFAPGGSTDIASRLFAEYIKTATNQTAVVENRAGANGSVGASVVKSSAPDGYTLMLSSNTVLIANELLYKTLPYDARADFTTVGIFGTTGVYMLCQPDAPYTTVAEFIAAAKAKPGDMLSPYFNTSSRLGSAVFAARAGVKLTEVPYKDVGQAVADMIGGRVNIMFMDAVAAAQHIQARTMRPLAIMTKDRLPDMPDVPTLGETLPNTELFAFFGISAPVGLPQPVRVRLNQLVNDCVADPRIGGKFVELGVVRKPLDLAGVDAFIETERKRWVDYVAIAGLQKE